MSRARIDARDWLIAAGVAVILLAIGVSGHRETTGGPISEVAVEDLLGLVLLAAGGLALAWRRRAPMTVLALTGLCALGYQAAGFDAFAVAYLVAVYAGRRMVTVIMLGSSRHNPGDRYGSPISAPWLYGHRWSAAAGLPHYPWDDDPGSVGLAQ
ncbi:hypothetical protein [Polymorphospora rubra]|uniref:Uncharacterized protein n=1 Tax=Polymorphospora rubra TaxID=338584 RepID=A0A810N975_9ACTN|nr:hypothetical protein [Polymorphospora rubra]BCJ68358.1 hypothetical protein Prubr_53790 [Polymorphospora rubra]